MQLNSEIVTTPPRAAATVVMLRDAPGSGLEVFLVKRHGLSDVLGGAYVFPGGKLDEDDARPGWLHRVDGVPADLRAALGERALDEATAVALYVAAAREAFEESGVLFASGAGAAQAQAATALAREGHAFHEILGHLDLRLAARALVPWSRWITPRMPSVMRKRFDTRFFVAEVPRGQTAQHDEHEAVESVWLTPRAALEQYNRRDIELAPPQIMTLAQLARLGSVRETLEAARARRPPLVEPEPHEQGDARVLCYPGDERHSVRERAMPGPTRLLHRDGWFQPPDGFDSLFV